MTERRPYARTGLNALKARVKLRGLKAIDMRTVAARELVEFRNGLTEDLGGEAMLSTAKKALINMAARAWLYLNHVDAWIAEQRTLVNRRTRSLFPVLVQRQGIAEHLAKILDRLGLERKSREALSLGQYLEARAAQDGAQAASTPPQVSEVEQDPPDSTCAIPGAPSEAVEAQVDSDPEHACLESEEGPPAGHAPLDQDAPTPSCEVGVEGAALDVVAGRPGPLPAVSRGERP